MIVKKTRISPSTTSFRIRVDPTSTKAPEEYFREFRRLSEKVLKSSDKGGKSPS